MGSWTRRRHLGVGYELESRIINLYPCELRFSTFETSPDGYLVYRVLRPLVNLHTQGHRQVHLDQRKRRGRKNSGVGLSDLNERDLTV